MSFILALFTSVTQTSPSYHLDKWKVSLCSYYGRRRLLATSTCHFVFTGLFKLIVGLWSTHHNRPRRARAQFNHYKVFDIRRLYWIRLRPLADGNEPVTPPIIFKL